MVFTSFTGLVLEVQPAQAVNLLNQIAPQGLALRDPPMLLAASQILQQDPTGLVRLIATNQAATSQVHLAQSPMLLEALNMLQSPDLGLIRGQPMLTPVLALQNRAPLVPNRRHKVLNQGLIVGNPRALNLIDLQSRALQVQNLHMQRVGRVRSLVVEVQKAGLVRDLAARHLGPRALKQGLIYKTVDPTLQI